MPAHFFCAQPHAPMSLLAMAALVGFAHNLEPIMLHDGHVVHVTGWHVAQSLPSLARRSFPSVPPRHSRCTRPHVSCSAWAPGLTALPPYACRRSSSTSPRQPFRLLASRAAPSRAVRGAFLCFRAYFGNFLPKYDVHLQYISQFCSAFKRT